MSGFESFTNPDDHAKPELSLSGYGDVLEMIGEIGTDDESIVNTLLDMIASEPIPDPDNPEAVETFLIKMRLVEARMNELLARSDALLDIQARIEARLKEVTPKST